MDISETETKIYKMYKDYQFYLNKSTNLLTEINNELIKLKSLEDNCADELLIFKEQVLCEYLEYDQKYTKEVFENILEKAHSLFKTYILGLTKFKTDFDPIALSIIEDRSDEYYLSLMERLYHHADTMNKCDGEYDIQYHKTKLYKRCIRVILHRMMDYMNI